jgi:hypothetical protein
LNFAISVKYGTELTVDSDDLRQAVDQPGDHFANIDHFVDQIRVSEKVGLMKRFFEEILGRPTTNNEKRP